jgi:hypothetical protein
MSKSITFEETEEIRIPSGGEYRQTILDFLESDFEKAKINLKFGRKAKYIASMLRGWVADNEPVKVQQSGNLVYLIRTDLE